MNKISTISALVSIFAVPFVSAEIVFSTNWADRHVTTRYVGMGFMSSILYDTNGTKRMYFHTVIDSKPACKVLGLMDDQLYYFNDRPVSMYSWCIEHDLGFNYTEATPKTIAGANWVIKEFRNKKSVKITNSLAKGLTLSAIGFSETWNSMYSDAL